MTRCLLIMALAATSLSCTASTYHDTETAEYTLGGCDYCVITEEDTYGYFDDAWQILGESFIMLEDGDPRLEMPVVRNSACAASIDWSRGFFSTTAWVDIADYESKTPIAQSYIRRGALYAGSHGNVLEVLKDIAKARAAGPPLPEPVELPPPTTQDPIAAGTIESRLFELKRLYDRGLIDQREYQRRRQAILDRL